MKPKVILILAFLGPCLGSFNPKPEEILRYVLSQGNIYDMVLQFRNEIDQKFTTELKRQGWSDEDIKNELETVKEPRDEDPLPTLIGQVSHRHLAFKISH